MHAQLAPVSRPLYAPERQARIGCHHAIDEDHSGFDVADEAIALALVRNPKTPLAMSMTLLARIADRDVAIVSMDRNIPEALRAAARRRVVFGASRG